MLFAGRGNLSFHFKRHSERALSDDLTGGRLKRAHPAPPGGGEIIFAGAKALIPLPALNCIGRFVRSVGFNVRASKVLVLGQTAFALYAEAA